MGIMDMIQRKKEQFFVARDSDKRQMQIQNLTREAERAKEERLETERVRQIQDQIKADNAKIHEARTAGSRAIGQKVSSGFKSFTTGVSKMGGTPNKNSPFYTGQGKSDVVNNVTKMDSGNSGVWNKQTFGSGNSSFNTGGVMGLTETKPKEKKITPKGNNIHIHIEK